MSPSFKTLKPSESQFSLASQFLPSTSMCDIHTHSLSLSSPSWSILQPHSSQRGNPALSQVPWGFVIRLGSFPHRTHRVSTPQTFLCYSGPSCSGSSSCIHRCTMLTRWSSWGRLCWWVLQLSVSSSPRRHDSDGWMQQKDEIAQHMTSVISSSGNVQSWASGPITCNILYCTPSVQNGQSKLRLELYLYHTPK